MLQHVEISICRIEIPFFVLLFHVFFPYKYFFQMVKDSL